MATEAVEAIEQMKQSLPELHVASLAGSYKEGKLRCIFDLADTYPDRPAKMYDVACDQCRSLSEDPRRRHTTRERSKTAPRTLPSIKEDEELGDDVPIAHVLFLPTSEALPEAPFPLLGKSGPSDEVTAIFTEVTDKADEPESTGFSMKE